MSTWQAHADADRVEPGMVFMRNRRWRKRTVKVVRVRRLAGHIALAKGHLVATVRDIKTGRMSEIYCATLAEPRKWKLIRSFNLGEDLTMYNEMFMASPDGQRERKRIQKVFDDLPSVQGEFKGYFDDGTHRG